MPMLRLMFAILAAASLLLCVVACAMWVRSYRVAERCGWATSRLDRPDRWLRDVNIWSAKGGVGVYCEEYRNLASDRGEGSPFFHVTDAAMDYPYISVVAAGVPERRWNWDGLGFARSARGRENLWFEFDGLRSRIADAQVSTSVVAPWWLLAAINAILPPIAARRMFITCRGRSRAKRGRCVRCGYDLRATLGRCPECGTDVANSATLEAVSKPPS